MDARAGGRCTPARRGRRKLLCLKSHRSDLNRRPLDYESRALPLSYGGAVPNLATCCSARYYGLGPVAHLAAGSVHPSHHRLAAVAAAHPQMILRSALVERRPVAPIELSSSG